MTAKGAGQDGMAEARPEAVMDRHRSAWRLERVSWALMALLLAAAVSGVFGGGPVSHARTGSRTVELEYDRLLRAAAPTEYRLQVRHDAAREGRLDVRIDQDLVDVMEMDAFVPEPEAVTAGPGYTQFTFRIEAGGDSPAHVVIGFQPTTFGRFRGRILVEGAPALHVSHLVYP